MIIKIIMADKNKIKELECLSAFTWEGMTLDEENLNEIAHAFQEENLVKENTEEIQGYVWFGKDMNELYNLHGDNRYADDLPFLAFAPETFNGTANLNVFKLMVGARWLDDIVMNNALNEAE
ncbi:MAG: hypothetical protein NC340_06925 [Ruminococcus flavefaciens]|nr:hypothetical protein [Ruminococcus flavefaciens]MCM1230412.1 hypothetical protein [Ruminococcus flavefaciens]